MTQNDTINTSQDYVNYTFNVESKGIAAVSGELLGLSNTVSNLLGDIAYKTSELLTHVETLSIGAGAAVGAMFTSITRDAIVFQQQIANVQAIGGESINGQDIGNAAMEYSNKFGMATSSMTEGLEALARAGITSTKVMKEVLAEGVKLSKLEGLDLEDSINDLIATTNLLSENGIDMNDPEYGEFVQQMNQHIVSTSESAPINAQNIIQSLQHVGGYASASGMDQDDLFAVIAQLGSRGTKGEMAGTALRAFIAAGQKDTAQRALARIGLNVSDLWNDNGETMLSISEMKDVLDKALEARGYSKQEKLEFYSDFAGYKQANQIMKIDTSEVQQYKESIADAWDLGKKLDTILGTVRGNLDRIWQTTKNFMTKVGSNLLDVMNVILTPVRILLDIITKIPFADKAVAIGMMAIGFNGLLKVINTIVPRFSNFFISLSNARKETQRMGGFWKQMSHDITQAKQVIEAIPKPQKMFDIQRQNQLYSKKQMNFIEDRAARLIYIQENWDDPRLEGLNNQEKSNTLGEIYKGQDSIFKEDFIKNLKLQSPGKWEDAIQSYLAKTHEHSDDIASGASYNIEEIVNRDAIIDIDKYVKWIWGIMNKEQEEFSNDNTPPTPPPNGPKSNRERNAEDRQNSRQAREDAFRQKGNDILRNRSQYGDYSYKVTVPHMRQFKYDDIDAMRDFEQQVMEDIRKKQEMYARFFEDKSIEAGRNRLKKSLTVAAKTDLGYEFSTGANTSDIKHILETGNIRLNSSHIMDEQLQVIAEILEDRVTGDTNADMRRFHTILNSKSNKDELLESILNRTQNQWNNKYYNNGKVGFFPTKALESASGGETARKIMEKVGVDSIEKVQQHFKNIDLNDSLLNECVDIMYEDKALVDKLINEELKYMYENLARVQNSISKVSERRRGGDFHNKGNEYETNLQKAREYVLEDYEPLSFQAEYGAVSSRPGSELHDLIIRQQNAHILEYDRMVSGMDDKDSLLGYKIYSGDKTGFQDFIYPLGTDIANYQRYGSNFRVFNIGHVPYNEQPQEVLFDFLVQSEENMEELRENFVDIFGLWSSDVAPYPDGFWDTTFNYEYAKQNGFTENEKTFYDLKEEFELIYRNYVAQSANLAQRFIELSQLPVSFRSYRGGPLFTPENEFGMFDSTTSTSLSYLIASRFRAQDPSLNKLLIIDSPEGNNGVIAHDSILNPDNEHLWSYEKELTLGQQPYLHVPFPEGYDYEKHLIMLTPEQIRAVYDIMGDDFEFKKNTGNIGNATKSFGNVGEPDYGGSFDWYDKKNPNRHKKRKPLDISKYIDKSAMDQIKQESQLNRKYRFGSAGESGDISILSNEVPLMLNKDTPTIFNMGAKLQDLLEYGVIDANPEYKSGVLGEASHTGYIDINPGAIKYHTDNYDEYGNYGAALLDTTIHEMTHLLMMHYERENYKNNNIPAELGIDNFETANPFYGYYDDFVAEYEANYVSSEVLTRLGIEVSEKSQKRMAAFKTLIEHRGYGNQIQYELLDSLVEEMLSNISVIGDVTKSLSTQIDTYAADVSNGELYEEMRPILNKIQTFNKNATLYQGPPSSNKGAEIRQIVSDIENDAKTLFYTEGIGDMSTIYDMLAQKYMSYINSRNDYDFDTYFYRAVLYGSKRGGRTHGNKGEDRRLPELQDYYPLVNPRTGKTPRRNDAFIESLGYGGLDDNILAFLNEIDDTFVWDDNYRQEQGRRRLPDNHWGTRTILNSGYSDIGSQTARLLNYGVYYNRKTTQEAKGTGIEEVVNLLDKNATKEAFMQGIVSHNQLKKWHKQLQDSTAVDEYGEVPWGPKDVQEWKKEKDEADQKLADLLKKRKEKTMEALETQNEIVAQTLEILSLMPAEASVLVINTPNMKEIFENAQKSAKEKVERERQKAQEDTVSMLNNQFVMTPEIRDFINNQGVPTINTPNMKEVFNNAQKSAKEKVQNRASVTSNTSSQVNEIPKWKIPIKTQLKFEEERNKREGERYAASKRQRTRLHYQEQKWIIQGQRYAKQRVKELRELREAQKQIYIEEREQLKEKEELQKQAYQKEREEEKERLNEKWSNRKSKQSSAEKNNTSIWDKIREAIVTGTGSHYYYFGGKKKIADEENQAPWQKKMQNWGLGATNKAHGYVNNIFNKLSQFNDKHYDEGRQEQLGNRFSQTKETINAILEPMRQFNDGLERAAEIFPPLTLATTALNTVIGIGEGVVWALETVESLLTVNRAFSALVDMGLITSEQALTLSRAIQTATTWGLTTAIAALEVALLPIVAIIIAIIAVIETLKFLEKQHAESLKQYQKALEEATAKNNIALSQYKDLKKARESETDAIKKQQAARKEAIALYELEAARVQKRKAVHDEAKVRNDAIWGEYGLRAELQKIGLGFIAGGDFQSQYANYDGSTANIRQIKESGLGQASTGDKAYVINTYDNNKMFFAEVEAYQDSLGELYDKESKLIEQYGSIDAARDTKEFREAVQEFADATGINGETAGKMLDWLETENKVNQATQAMKAQTRVIIAKADAKATAAEIDGESGLDDMGTLQQAMIMSQAQDIYKDAYDYMWWEKFQADLFGILWTLIDHLMVWDLTDHAEKYWKKSEAYQEGMEELSQLGVRGLADIGDEMADNANRRDYGTGVNISYGDTPFGGAVDSLKTMELEYAQQMEREKQYTLNETNKFRKEVNRDMEKVGKESVEGFKTGLDQHSPGAISRGTQDEMMYSQNFIQESTPQLSKSTEQAGQSMSETYGDSLKMSDETQKEMINVKDAINDSKKDVNPVAYDAGKEAGQEYSKGFKEGLKDLYAQISSPEALEQTLEDRILVRQGYGTPKGADPNDPEVQELQERRRHETESKLVARGFNLPSFSSFAKSEGKAAYRVAKGGGLRSWKDTSVIGRIANAAEIGITEGSVSKGLKALFAPKYGEEFGTKGAKHAINKALGREAGETVAKAPTGKIVGTVDNALGKVGAKGSKYVEKGLSKLGIESGESLTEAGGKFIARNFGDDAAKMAVKGGSKLAKMGSKALPFVGTAITAGMAIAEHNPFEKHYNEDGSEKRAFQSTGEVAGEVAGALASDVIGVVGGPVAGMVAGLVLEPIGEAIGGTIGWMADEVVNTKFTDAWAGFNDALGGVPNQIVDFIDQSPIGQAGHAIWDGLDSLTGGWLGDTWEGIKNSSIAELTGLDQLGGALQGVGEWLFGGGEEQEQIPTPDQITDEEIMQLEKAGMLDEYMAQYGLDKEQKSIFNNKQAQQVPAKYSDSTIVIKNININTEDDPEKIKSALMNLIIEMQEQVAPRTVSRTVGEPPAASSTSDTQNTNNQAQAEGTDPQSGEQNGNSTTNNNNGNTNPTP